MSCYNLTASHCQKSLTGVVMSLASDLSALADELQSRQVIREQAHQLTDNLVALLHVLENISNLQLISAESDTLYYKYRTCLKPAVDWYVLIEWTVMVEDELFSSAYRLAVLLGNQIREEDEVPFQIFTGHRHGCFEVIDRLIVIIKTILTSNGITFVLQ